MKVYLLLLFDNFIDKTFRKFTFSIKHWNICSCFFSSIQLCRVFVEFYRFESFYTILLIFSKFFPIFRKLLDIFVCFSALFSLFSYRFSSKLIYCDYLLLIFRIFLLYWLFFIVNFNYSEIFAKFFFFFSKIWIFEHFFIVFSVSELKTCRFRLENQTFPCFLKANSRKKEDLSLLFTAFFPATLWKSFI